MTVEVDGVVYGPHMVRELREERNAMRWRPMDTAPRDGDTEILLLCGGDQDVWGWCIASWDDEFRVWSISIGDGSINESVAVGWMPVPAPESAAAIRART